MQKKKEFHLKQIKIKAQIEKYKELEKELKKVEKILRRKRKGRNTKKIPEDLHASTRMKYKAVKICSSIYSVRRECKVLELKESTYYR